MLQQEYTMITGATGGLGGAFVKECEKRGWNLFITSTSKEKLEEVKKSVQDISNIDVKCCACDISSKADRLAMYDYISKNKITITRVICNAGYITEGKALSHENDELQKVIQVNCEGNVDIAINMIKNRDKSKRFHLIVVSSFAAFNPMPQMAIYGATKSFLLNYFVALHEELKTENVFITTVCPGGMATTPAMKNAIKVQGIGGKITQNKIEDVAKKSIAVNMRNKPILVMGFVNKLLRLLVSCVPRTVSAKFVCKRWKKSQAKLNKLKNSD